MRFIYGIRLICQLFGWVNMGPIAYYSQLKGQMENHPATRAKVKDGAMLFYRESALKYCWRII